MKKLLTLALAGIAIKYFLDSEKGNQVLIKLKDWLAEAQDRLDALIGQTEQKPEQLSAKNKRAFQPNKD